jgi:hypothetical protein
MYRLSGYIVSLLGLIALLVVPLSTSAEVGSLVAAKSSYQVGDTIPVSFVLNTEGRSINTISGTIDIPQDRLQILGVQYGNSIVGLWVERPTIDYGRGVITFTGGIPGGYNGANGPILSFTVRAKKAGTANTSFLDLKLLLNDGSGTQSNTVAKRNLSLEIGEAAPKPGGTSETKVESLPEATADTTPPERPTAYIASDPAIEDGKYFVAFNAIDKQSGIARYEITESPWLISFLAGELTSASTSPVVLLFQHWPTAVTVRAYDQAGNQAETTVAKPASNRVVILGILVALILGILLGRRFRILPKPASRKRVV